MGKGKGGGENSKKAAGNAKKAEAAAKKKSAEDEKIATLEDAEWADGARRPNKKQIELEAKREEARRKKADRLAEIQAEADAIKVAKPKGGAKKTGAKPGGIDSALGSLSAHNIDEAISALEITTGKDSTKLDRHPERRFKSALAAFEERRLPEIRQEHPGLRLNQYKQLLYDEFKKSPENPFNQVTVAYDATQEDVMSKRAEVRKGKEERLAH